MKLSNQTLKLERILFVVSILCVFIFNYANQSYAKLLANGSMIACIGLELLIYIKTKQIAASKELIGMIFFIALCCYSVTYSYAPKDSLGKCMTMTILLLYLISLLNFMQRSETNSQSVVSSYILAALLGALSIIVFSDWRRGTRVNDIIGNSNQVSAYLSYTIPIIIYGIKQKKLNRTLGILMIVIFFFSIMISGSRSALVVCFSGAALYFLLNTKIDRTIVFRILIGLVGGCLILYLLYYLIMNNRTLYQIIGRRYISFFQIMQGKNSLIHETSTQGRAEMRELAFTLWTRNIWTFIFGNGIGSFAKYYSQHGGIHAFCHNNYLELLYGVGILGFLANYSIYLRPLMNCWPKKGEPKNPFLIACLVVLIQIFMMHYFVVFYYQKVEIIILAILIHYSAKAAGTKGGENE